jgi:hypothetical protein
MIQSVAELKTLSEEGRISDRELLEGLFAVSGFEKVTVSEFSRINLRNPGMV